MPGQGRLGDQAQIQQDAHGCPGCPHPGVGPAIAGSANVFVNGLPALRVDDIGIHGVCCGTNMWQAQHGSATVFINGKAAFRKDDASRHCGGSGKLIEGSDNVIVGDSSGGGGGGGGGGGSSSSGGGGGSSSGGGSAGNGGGGSGGSSGAGASSSSSGASGAPGAAPASSAATPADKAVDVFVLDVEDEHFHFDSAVLLPDSRDPATGAQVTGLSALRDCFLQLQSHPQQKILVAGHTDTTGDPGYNQQLSQLRARNVLAALEGDKSGWVSVCEQKSKTEDQQAILRWVHDIWGWPCDPGAVDNRMTQATRDAIAAFQKSYNEERSPRISESGVVDHATWGAFFEVYMESLAELLGVTDDGMRAHRQRLEFLSPGRKAVGFGEKYPTDHPGVDNYESAINRRVDLLFFDPGEEPASNDDIYAKKLPSGDQKFKIVPLPSTPVVRAKEVAPRIAEILGLYAPGFVHPDEQTSGNARRAGFKPGYVSGDDRGRIFINTVPRKTPADKWDDTWKKDKQYIELTVEIDAFPANAVLPHGMRITWTWADPDDPSNDDMRDDAGRIVDPNDYSPGALPGDDNAGHCDFPTADSGKIPVFEEIAPYKLKKIDDKTYETVVHDGKARVRMHCTNIAGDNFVVQATLPPRPSLKVLAQPKTGAMTMWKRIDVEQRQMQDALPLPVDKVATAYEKSFVQMDFAAPVSAPRLAFLGADRDSADDAASRYVTKASGVFTHEGQPGWFFVASAHAFAQSDASVTVVDVFDGNAQLFRVGNRQTIVLPQRLGRTDVRAVLLEDGDQNVLFGVRRVHDDTPSGQCTLDLDEIDFHPDFPVDTDGDTNSAYTTTDNYWPAFAVLHGGGTNDGYQFTNPVQVTVVAGGTQVAGISPDVPHAGKRYFAGRTIIFTQSRVVNRGSRVEVRFGGSFVAGDVVTLTVGSHTVSYTAQAGDDATAVCRGVARAAQNDAAFKAAFAVRRRNRVFLRIESMQTGPVDDGVKVTFTATGGGAITPDNTVLAKGGIDQDDVASIIAHEFGHAFGFPHKCGYHTWQKGDELSCAMNYFHTWIYQDPAHPENGVTRFNTGKPGSPHFCGKHIDGVRRVHLEKNPALWKWK